MQPLNKRYGPGVANITIRVTPYDKAILTYLNQLYGIKPADIFRMFLRRFGRRLEQTGKLKCIQENGHTRWILETPEAHQDTAHVAGGEQ